jgi:hypothetical protein
MGVVFRARHLRLNRLVALKMLLDSAYCEPRERERFQREAEAVAGLRHENIVRVYDVGDHEGRPYFTMEYVEGGSLAQKLAGAPLPTRPAAQLVATLAEAMQVAHQGGVVHRDLKPANVLLTTDGTAKISDFGLARRMAGETALTQSGVPLGTPSYMAPEQARGQTRAIGPAVDVYALGAILYELLTGRPPFQGETSAETLLQVIQQEPVPPVRLNPRVPRGLETICLKCLHKEPGWRYSSARELADDLGRFVRGEPVAARPVGPLERVVKWVRRKPTVAGLSAVAALAVVVGTVASLLFGVEAHRKADALKEQSNQLQEQTRAAQENEKEVGRVLLASMLTPIDRNPHKLTESLDTAEVDAVRQLRAAPAPLRLQFLETALRDPEAARRIGRRADWVAQAIVGCDRALRADVARLVAGRIQEPDAPQEVLLACARLGLAVNLADRAWAERSTDALLVELRDPLVDRDDYPQLAEALAAVSQRLPPTQAADPVARGLDVFRAILPDREGRVQYYQQLGQAIVAISPALDVAAAARVAEELGAIIRRPDCPPVIWPSLSTALAAVCRRLPASDTAALENRAIDFILASRDAAEKKDKVQDYFYAQALGALCGRLDAVRASRTAEALLAMLGDAPAVGATKDAYTYYGPIPSTLTKVAERLDVSGGLRAAEGLVLVLRRSSGNLVMGVDELRAALVAVCKPLDAAVAAQVAGTLVAAVRDPKTKALVRTLFADALAALSGRLALDQAASLESGLVDSLVADLADAKSRQFRGLQGRALAAACGRPGAARATEALTAALLDPQTPAEALKPLAAALAVVIGQLPPREATSYAKEAVDLLDSLWRTKTSSMDRAHLAVALAALWPSLDPADAAARAKRAAADLEDAFRDSIAAPTKIYRLGMALPEVYNHLDPAERSRRANAVVDTLVAARRRPRNDSLTTLQLTGELATLCEILDRPNDFRIADVLLAVLDDPKVQPSHFLLYERMFQQVAPRLDEHDLQRLLQHPLAAGRLQRVLLDVLAGPKNRSFRNTWDYLDATGV